MKKYSVMEKLSSPDKIKKATFSQLNLLAKETRKYLIEVISNNGGHLASNLGAVEITLALLKCFNPPHDKVVFDVGHQCYTYKLFTKRMNRFYTLRQENGISGFPKTCESEYDSFIAGHASTSLSAAWGLKRALTLQGKKDFVVAVIGDGALTGGMAYEALNNIGKTKENIIIILNDNEMAISKNEGAIAKYLSNIRNKTQYFKIKKATEKTITSIPLVGQDLKNLAFDTKKIVKQIFYPSTFFEDMGLRYYGPVDGHDIKELCEVINEAKNRGIPAVIHVNTKKGKGYKPSELNPGQFHGISRFNKITGESLSVSTGNFSETFGQWLLEKGRENKNICAITAAMEHGTGLQYFAREFKNEGRYYDVGIAEEHAVTFSAALAQGGAIPVFAIYSTFLQRGYDQLIHDAAIEKHHVVFAVDRAGIVGDDGETHQGLFDVAFLSTIPNFQIFSPSNYNELKLMLNFAVDSLNCPVAVRYPRGSEDLVISDYNATGKSYDLIKSENNEILLLTYGRLFGEAIKAFTSADSSFDIMKLNRIYPIDGDAVIKALEYKNILIFEEGIKNGSVAQNFASSLMEMGYKGNLKIFAIEEFVPQGKIDNMLKKYELDSNSMRNAIHEIIGL